jgi:hypothetical protein
MDSYQIKNFDVSKKAVLQSSSNSLNPAYKRFLAAGGSVRRLRLWQNYVLGWKLKYPAIVR